MASNPTGVDVQFQLPAWDSTDHNFWNVSAELSLTPVTWPGCPTMIWMAIPVMKPAVTGLRDEVDDPAQLHQATDEKHDARRERQRRCEGHGHGLAVGGATP